MADLEFFFDPVCPWAWITSRWVAEVQTLRDYDVEWRFISLAVINEGLVADWYTPSYRQRHLDGLSALRVADQIRLTDGNAAVGAYYAALGTELHNNRADERPDGYLEALLQDVLRTIGSDPALASHGDEASHDPYIRSDTAVAFERTGKDVGTPIITFHPGTDREASFFGPVISSIPRGDDALRLWDAVEVVATTSGMAELKRSIRGRPDFS
jgi:hypothetical protein